MFPGHTYYPELHFRPERGGEHNWHVRCMSGALQVLRTREYATFLQGKSRKTGYTVNFANNSAARIKPGDELWRVLAEVAKIYKVEVYTLSLFSAKYVPWTGAKGDLGAFDCICISKRRKSRRKKGVNRSKVNDPRFWSRWRNSAAVAK